MKFRSPAVRLATVAALASIAGVAFAQETQRVAVKTAGLSPFVAKSVEEKAAMGVDELRRYVERTRMVHGLYIPDLVREEDPAAVEQAKAPADDEAPVVAKRQQPAAATMTASKAPKTQVAKNAKPTAAATQVAKGGQAAPRATQVAKAAKPAQKGVQLASAKASRAEADAKLALAGQKTKRA